LEELPTHEELTLLKKTIGIHEHEFEELESKYHKFLEMWEKNIDYCKEKPMNFLIEDVKLNRHLFELSLELFKSYRNYIEALESLVPPTELSYK
jgi:hypothetical protein